MTFEVFDNQPRGMILLARTDSLGDALAVASSVDGGEVFDATTGELVPYRYYRPGTRDASVVSGDWRVLDS